MRTPLLRNDDDNFKSIGPCPPWAIRLKSLLAYGTHTDAPRPTKLVRHRYRTNSVSRTTRSTHKPYQQRQESLQHIYLGNLSQARVEIIILYFQQVGCRTPDRNAQEEQVILLLYRLQQIRIDRSLEQRIHGSY